MLSLLDLEGIPSGAGSGSCNAGRIELLDLGTDIVVVLDDVQNGVCDIHCLCANVGADLVAIDDEWNVWFGRRALVDAGLPS